MQLHMPQIFGAPNSLLSLIQVSTWQPIPVKKNPWQPYSPSGISGLGTKAMTDSRTFNLPLFLSFDLRYCKSSPVLEQIRYLLLLLWMYYMLKKYPVLDEPILL
jgi:hypothetical protein